MDTDFSFIDEDGSIKQARLIMAFNYNENEYIVYDIKEEDNLEEDIIHIREYKLIDNIPYLYRINNKEFRTIKKLIKTQIEEVEKTR